MHSTDAFTVCRTLSRGYSAPLLPLGKVIFILTIIYLKLTDSLEIYVLYEIEVSL